MHNVSNERLVTIAARMYHEQQRTQLEIAENLNLSQVTVCRLLKRAEGLGIVRTTVSPPFGTFVDLEELLPTDIKSKTQSTAEYWAWSWNN